MVGVYAHLLFASKANSRTPPDECSGAATISDREDLAALALCPTFSGDVTIATGEWGNVDLGDELESIEGELKSFNVTMTSLIGDSIHHLQSLDLEQCMILGLSLPLLTDVSGTIRLVSLPGLSDLSFTTGLSAFADLDVENTHLSSIDGIAAEEAGSITFKTNDYMENITMPALQRVHGTLTIAQNGDELSVDLPSLTSIGGALTIRNASAIALPSLATAAADLAIEGNAPTTLGLSALETVGGDLEVADNPRLANVTLPKLRSVGGRLVLKGNFSVVEVPALEHVERGLSLVLSGGSACAMYDETAWMHLERGVVKGGVEVECDGKRVDVHEADSASLPAPAATTTQAALSGAPSSSVSDTASSVTSASASAAASADASGAAAPGASAASRAVGWGAVVGGLMLTL